MILGAAGGFAAVHNILLTALVRGEARSQAGRPGKSWPPSNDTQRAAVQNQALTLRSEDPCESAPDCRCPAEAA